MIDEDPKEYVLYGPEALKFLEEVFGFRPVRDNEEYLNEDKEDDSE